MPPPIFFLPKNSFYFATELKRGTYNRNIFYTIMFVVQRLIPPPPVLLAKLRTPMLVTVGPK